MKAMRRIALILAVTAGLLCYPCGGVTDVGGEANAAIEADEWSYSLQLPEESYDCIEETTLYRYSDPDEILSTEDHVDGYELSGKRIFSSEAGPWLTMSPEASGKHIEDDMIHEQRVEKKSVHFSYAYMDSVKDWFWLNPGARHYVKYMNEIGNHVLTGTLPVEEDYSICEALLQVYSENDIAQFGIVDDVDSSDHWCAQIGRTIDLGKDSGEFGEVYILIYDGERVNQFETGSKREIAYVWGKKDTSNPDVMATEKRDIYRLVNEQYRNVFTRDNWSSWNGTRPAEKEGRKIESAQGYRFKNRTTQKISAPSSVSRTYGCASFNLNASAKTPLTFKSSNSSVAAVSSAGIVTVRNPGSATITVTAAETNAYFSNTAKVRINVALKAPILTARKASRTSIKLSWTSTPGAGGYEVYKYSSSRKKYLLAATRSARVKSTTNKHLKRHRRHYYKVRSYRVVNGKRVYSKFSTIKSVKL